MRLKVVIETDKIPVIYRHRILSLIKEALNISNSDYKNKFYSNKTPKPFTFNLVIPFDRETKKEEIKISSEYTVKEDVFYPKNKKIDLYISSYDYEFLINVYNGLLKMKIFSFSSDNEMLINGDKLDLKIINIIMLKETDINNNEIVFRTSSPIILEDEKDKPLLYNNDSFNNKLNELQNKLFNSLLNRKLYEELELIPLKMKEQVIKHTLKEFRENTKKPIMYLTGSKGLFKLKGNPEDLKIIYNIGLGNRTSQGFGMLEIVG